MALTTVTGSLVSVNAIQGTLIADNAITAVHIATNAVSGTLIADNAVTAVHIAQNTITVTQLADDCVESDKIADGVITTNHLNKAMISSQTEVTAVAGDYVLLGDTSDSNNLKKALVSDFGVAGISSSADATTITIDSSERVGIPAIGQVNVLGTQIPYLSVNGINAQNAHVNIHRHRANSLGGYLSLSKSRSDTKDFTIVQNGDALGTISFQGADGSQFQQGASIAAVVSDAPAAGDMPADIVFSTTLDGSNTLVEHTRILNNGAFKHKQGTSAYANATSNYNEICSNADATANLLVRQGSTYYADCINLWYYAGTGPNNVHSNFLHAFDQQATRAKILSNGGFANYQSNDSNLCDEREKKNITTASNTWNDVKSWTIKKFHYNEDSDSDAKRYGVIAQDIEKTNPDLIVDWEKKKAAAQELWQEADKPLPDGVSVGDEKSPAQVQVMRKAVKEQQMYIMAIKALQEAMTEIDSLKARVKTLEG